jgi:antitoxin MazE
MTTATITKLVPIGNSQGVRIPKAFIELYQLDKGTLTLTPERWGLLLTPKRKPREGRAEQFRKAKENWEIPKVDEEFLSFPSYFDNHERTWPE